MRPSLESSMVYFAENGDWFIYTKQWRPSHGSCRAISTERIVLFGPQYD